MRHLLILLSLGLALGACSGEETSGEVTVPEDSDRVLLTVTSEGGFVPVDFNLVRMPRFVLMADRTLYFQGVTTLEFPGPLLPNIQQTTLDEDSFAEILALVAELGLSDIDEEEVDNQGMERIADATTEFITLHDEDGAHRYGFYALEVSESRSTDRLLARELLQVLEQGTATEQSSPYEPDRLQVAAGPPVDMDLVGSTEPWPLSMSFDEMDGWALGWHCVEVTGAEVDRLAGVFETATQATLWETGSETYSIRARPLLPGETACTGAPQGS